MIQKMQYRLSLIVVPIIRHRKQKSKLPQSGALPQFRLSTMISTMVLKTLCQCTKAKTLQRVKNNAIKNNTTRRDVV